MQQTEAKYDIVWFFQKIPRSFVRCTIGRLDNLKFTANVDKPNIQFSQREHSETTAQTMKVDAIA